MTPAPLSPAAPGDDTAHVPTRRQNIVLATVLVGSFMALLDQYIVIVALPTIRSDLHTSVEALELVIAGYVVPYSVLLVTGGRLGDRYGPKRIYLVGMLLFTASSLACGLAPSIDALVAARVVQGASAALMTPQVLATIQLVFPASRRTEALGVFSTVNGSASILGQVAGGLLIRLDLLGLSWRTLFLVNLPIGVAGSVGAALLLPELRARAAPTLDLAGVALLTATLSLLMVPLVEGRPAGWPLWLVAALAACAPVFAVFLRHERRLKLRGRDPLVDVTLFRSRSVAIGVPLLLLLFAQAGGVFFALSLTLQTGLQVGPLVAGLAFAPVGAGFTTASFLAPRLVRRFGRRVVPAGYLLSAVTAGVTTLIALRAHGHVSVWALAVPLGVQSFGNGLGTSPLVGIILSDVRREDSGLAAGTVATAIQLGQALGVTLLGLLFATVLGSAAGAAAYTDAFAATVATAGAILIAMSALAAYLVFSPTDRSMRTSASPPRRGTSRRLPPPRAPETPPPARVLNEE